MRPRAYCLVFIALQTWGCASYFQLRHDELRYGTVFRGSEEYFVNTERDSLEAMLKVSDSNTKFHAEYLGVQQSSGQPNKSGTPKGGAPAPGEGKTRGKPMSPKPPRSMQRDVEIAQLPPRRVVETFPISPESETSGSMSTLSHLETFWPSSLWTGTTTIKVEDSEKKTTTTTSSSNVASDLLVRAMSSTASALHMRDLVTEPSFPGLVPMRRSIQLGCLPPADNVVFEAMSRLQATVEKGKTSDADEGKSSSQVSADLSTEERTTAFKVVEETQKTWFLQWALYRLCEASLNSSANFRNVLPIVIHDVIRRSAEMSNDAEQAITNRIVEQEKTRRAVVEGERDRDVKKLELEIENSKLKAEHIKREIVEKEVTLAQSKKVTADAELAAVKERRLTICFEEQMKKDPKPEPQAAKASCEAVQ